MSAILHPSTETGSEILHGRFVLHRRLGAGGFGVVYEAHDLNRDARVALKQLHRLDAGAIYQFKQEFRSLADVTHPNLVGLHELFAVDDEWYFTMDLVRGEPFTSYVRPGETTGPAENAATTAVDTAETVAAAIEVSGEGVTMDASQMLSLLDLRVATRHDGVLDVGRLRAALVQLVRGVAAIHAAGKLHCDLKPSNVLVDSTGRVVVLDFGLVMPAHSQPGAGITIRSAGTPEYMAPEQAFGQPIGPAADWYAVGSMLFQALTGILPFVAERPADIIWQKARERAPDPRDLVPALPDDLCDLCVRLLDRDPFRRPSGDEILEHLAPPETRPASSCRSTDVAPKSTRTVFVGRERHQMEIWEGFVAAQEGATSVVFVHGQSGMGKSTLVRQVLDRIGREGSAQVLEGRCYERESVPYKVFDGLMDVLADHLVTLDHADKHVVLPDDIGPLARLFPVLRNLPSVIAQAHKPEPPDRYERRREAFEGLRRLLRALSAQSPLVLALDDVQWGDIDSAALLLDLLAPPAPPRLLVLASYRSEDAEASDFLRATRYVKGNVAGLFVREVVVGPLEVTESRALCRALLPEASPEVVEAIAEEAHGSPFFVSELSRHVQAMGEKESLSLGDLLARRIQALPESARRLLEMVACAGKPIDLSIVRLAATLSGEAEQTALAALRTGSLVRPLGPRGREQVDTFHDRVRECVLQILPAADAAHCHLRLAVTLEAAEGADPEDLAVHFRAGGDKAKALSYMVRAAERAADTLAFDHAVALSRIALQLAGPHPAHSLKVKLAEALALAGHGSEAARTFMDAASTAPPSEAFVLKRLAAEYFLRSGHVDQGLVAARSVLAAVGLELPASPARALASLLYHRVRQRVIGLSFQERSEHEIPKDMLTRIDVCWSIGNGLGGVDLIRSADFQARHLYLALAAGEPYRVSRALSWEAILVAVEGQTDHATELTRTAEALANKIQNPHAIAWAAAASAVTAYVLGAWREASVRCERAVRIFRSQSTDAAWEVASLEVFYWIRALFNQGEIAEFRRRSLHLVQSAEERGNLYVATIARTFLTPYIFLFDDKPAEAHRESERAIRSWSSSGLHLQHQFDLVARAEASLYEGEGIRALKDLEQGIPKLKSSQLLRIKPLRMFLWQVRARAALAAHVQKANPSLLNRAAEDAERLEKEGLPWGRMIATFVRACIALARREWDPALVLFTKTRRAALDSNMALVAAAAAYRQGQLIGGDEGAGLVRTNAEWMIAQTIKNPERATAMLAPGTAEGRGFSLG